MTLIYHPEWFHRCVLSLAAPFLVAVRTICILLFSRLMHKSTDRFHYTVFLWLVNTVTGVLREMSSAKSKWGSKGENIHVSLSQQSITAGPRTHTYNVFNACTHQRVSLSALLKIIILALRLCLPCSCKVPVTLYGSKAGDIHRTIFNVRPRSPQYWVCGPDWFRHPRPTDNPPAYVKHTPYTISHKHMRSPCWVRNLILHKIRKGVGPINLTFIPFNSISFSATTNKEEEKAIIYNYSPWANVEAPNQSRFWQHPPALLQV